MVDGSRDIFRGSGRVFRPAGILPSVLEIIVTLEVLLEGLILILYNIELRACDNRWIM